VITAQAIVLLDQQDAAVAYFGTGLVAAAVFILLAIAFAADAVFEIWNVDGLGYWMMRWSRQYPAWVLFFSLVLGAMVGHFFTKPEIYPLRRMIQDWLHAHGVV